LEFEVVCDQVETQPVADVFAARSRAEHQPQRIGAQRDPITPDDRGAQDLRPEPGDECGVDTVHADSQYAARHPRSRSRRLAAAAPPKHVRDGHPSCSCRTLVSWTRERTPSLVKTARMCVAMVFTETP